MAKKKLLIINKSFELGGIQMALANMLPKICDEYDVTLAIFHPRGPLKERVPESVKLLKLSPFVETLGMSYADCKKHGSALQKIFKLCSSAWARAFGNTLPIRVAFLFQKRVRNFDVVISYHQEPNEKTMVAGFGRFAIEKCDSPVKIAWIHGDMIATNLATKKNLEIYSHFNKIVSVSKTTMNVFIKAFPALAEKCDYCYNYVPVEDIIEKSKLPCEDMIARDDEIVLFSACRLVEEKGIIPAMKNLLPLWEQGNKLKWYLAGEGPNRRLLEDFIHEHKLKEKVILLGFKQNPYPYIRKADYLFLPSLHETFSMVAAEAHILSTPVIANDIPVMREVLGENDYLCKNGDYFSVLSQTSKSNKKQEHNKAEEAWINRFSEVIYDG